MGIQNKKTLTKMEEFNRRCDAAVESLTKLASNYLINGHVQEYSRLTGKLEGIKLAQSYANEMIKATTGEK